MKDFRKSDLKDGMVLTIRYGSKYHLISNEHYFFTCGQMQGFCALHLKDYDDDLIYKDDTRQTWDSNDIVKVEYMGETIWERKEYVRFDVARKSGRKFKHQSWVDYVGIDMALGRLAHGVQLKSTNEMLDDKMWEIEQ